MNSSHSLHFAAYVLTFLQFRFFSIFITLLNLFYFTIPSFLSRLQSKHLPQGNETSSLLLTSWANILQWVSKVAVVYARLYVTITFRFNCFSLSDNLSKFWKIVVQMLMFLFLSFVLLINGLNQSCHFFCFFQHLYN